VLDLHAEKVMKLTKILHGELVLESTDGPLQKSHGGSCEDNIINVQQEIDCVWTRVVNKQRRICLGCNKTELKKEGGKPTEPSSWCLLEAVEGAVESTDMTWAS